MVAFTKTDIQTRRKSKNFRNKPSVLFNYFRKAPRSPNKIVEQLIDDEYENSEGVEEEVLEPRKLSRYIDLKISNTRL